MRIYGIPRDGERVAAFEVDNLWIGRRGFCRIVDRIPGVRWLRKPAFLSWFVEDIFCEFEVEGVAFVAEEPYGDNSRYWVGPAGTGVDGKQLEYLPQIEIVREAFEKA